MIFKRFAANLRAQNWFAIGIEIIIVIVGVFIGTQVSNWNDERRSAAETEHVLDGLKPQIRSTIENFALVRRYYGVTRAYAETAFAGWRGDPAVSDRDFVIAAYQASQNTISGVDSASWSEVLGGDRLRTIEDQRLREDLTLLMTTDFAAVGREVFTTYRENVRKVIPEDIQDQIRARCGDRRVGNGAMAMLPASCQLTLPEDRFREGAKALRAHPELVGEMRWHFAAIATYSENISNLENIGKRILARLDETQ